MSKLKVLFYSIRQWCQPYWVPPPITSDTKQSRQSQKSQPETEEIQSHEIVKKKITSKKKKNIPFSKPGETILNASEWLGKFKDSTITIRTLRSNSFMNVESLEKLPAPNEVWYFHDENYHILLSHLGPRMGFRFKDRDSARRKKLRPLIRPLGMQYDRTHLIPYGYHGNENDSRLLIGWDPDLNRKDMQEFENKVKDLGFPVYWLCVVKKTSDGAVLAYTVWDARSMNKIMSKPFKMVSEFEWHS